MANHRLALPWECSQLLGVCNAKTSWWGEVENSKRKEGLPSRALHPRDYFLLEIMSVLFTIFINSGPQWIMRDTPAAATPTTSWWDLLWESWGLRENGSSCTSCLRCAPTAAPACTAPHPLSLWGKRLHFPFANINWRPRTQSSQSSSITAADITDTVLRRPELNWGSPLERSKRSATVPTSLMHNVFSQQCEICVS